MGSRHTAGKPGLYAGRRAPDHSDYLGFYYIFRSKVQHGEDLSLTIAGNPLWKRLLWLVLIWGGCVLALAAVSMLFRLLMTVAGFKAR